MRSSRHQNQELAMSEASNPLFPVTLFTPEHGDAHDPHPMVALPSGQSHPFKLLFDPGTNTLQVSFQNNLTSGQDPQGVGVRIFFCAFEDSDPSTYIWSNTLGLTASGSGTQGSETIPLASQNVPTRVWIGAWWDNGTYASTAAGIAAYFAAHPSGGTHHTVPIRIT
jgi:hypothetical protein